MKAKRSLRQTPSPKVKQKLSLVYAAAGIAIAAVVGIGVFIYLNLGTQTDSIGAPGNESTKNNYTGSWTTNGSWTDGSATTTTDIRDNVEIFGYITHVGNMSYKAGSNATLTVTDTLVIDGNLVMGNGSDIVVRSGGVLVVTGNFTAENKIVIGNGGVIAIGGNMIFPNNNQDTYTGTGGELFVLGTVSGNPTATGAQQGGGALQNKHPAIANFLSGSASTLPIILAYFKVQAQEDRIVAVWATDQEIDNDYFTIERSADGKHFEEIATTKGAGNSSSTLTYSHTDQRPLIGTSYYRLKQTDFDGKFSYSNIQTVTNKPQGIFTNVLTIQTVAPNPFAEHFSMNYSLPSDGLVEVRLMDMQGITVASETLEGFEGDNQYEFYNRKGLKSGTYLISITHNNITSKVVRLIKK